MSITLLTISFFIIAVLYSTVGFGGGSSYIAILLLANLPLLDIRWIALVCNIIVVSTGCWYFYKADLLKLKQLLPLIVLSVPFAFMGGAIQPDAEVYQIVAALALIAASFIMIINHKKSEIKKISKPVLSSIGGGIGLLSGFIGIGGGIFLSPVLHILKWESAKYISAAASFFILVNSCAGILGQSVNNPQIDWELSCALGFSVYIGGQIGNRMNIYILPPEKIKLLSALLIAFVGFRILFIQIF